MINIEKVDCIEDAKICDELLTNLIQSEREFNNNIKSDYVVKDFLQMPAPHQKLPSSLRY